MKAGAPSFSLLLTSPFGDDTLPIQRGTLHAIALKAHEQISRPFEARLTVVSDRRSIDPDELLFQPVCATLRTKLHGDRFFNGVVRRVEAVGQARRDRWTYHLDVVPRLWFLGQSRDCRIFQRKTVIQILQTLFGEHQVAPVEFKIFGKKDVREYTTQYNESDLRFAHRLMQEEGYYYYFEHSKINHKLIVTDRNQSFAPITDPAEYRVIHAGDNIDVFPNWSQALETAHGEVRLQDYDPTKPAVPVAGRQTTTLKTAGAGKRDVFHWPAHTVENPVAAERARFKIEAEEAAAGLREGHGADPEFCPGRRFALAKDPFTGATRVDLALRGVWHDAADDTWIAGSAEPSYRNGFTCFLQKTQWREPLDIPRPTMAGIFSAIVLGNKGEEIHADPIGRIKVRLLFDRRKETVADMATWVRVMQPWAGNRWGWQHLPRVDTEVAVSFMNGDPDAPVVVGSFYNQDMRPVFAIPAEQNRQGFRSRSTLRGGTRDYSELSFDDSKGKELVFLHAQKDMTTEVENDQRLDVDRNRTVTIGRDETVTVRRHHSLTSQTGTIDLSAARSITLRVGASRIEITPASIQITSPTVNLVSTGPLGIGIRAVGPVMINGAAGITLQTAGPLVTTASKFVAVPPPNIPV